MPIYLVVLGMMMESKCLHAAKALSSILSNPWGKHRCFFKLQQDIKVFVLIWYKQSSITLKSLFAIRRSILKQPEKQPPSIDNTDSGIYRLFKHLHFWNVLVWSSDNCEGKEKVTRSIFLGAEDKAALKEMIEKYNVEFNTQTTPSGSDGSVLVDIKNYL